MMDAVDDEKLAQIGAGVLIACREMKEAGGDDAVEHFTSIIALAQDGEWTEARVEAHQLETVLRQLKGE